MIIKDSKNITGKVKASWHMRNMQNKHRSGIINIAAIIALTASVISLVVSGCAPAKEKYDFQKGMCYGTWGKDRFTTSNSDASLEAMAKIGVKWVALVSNWYQDSCNSTEIFATENTASDEGMVHAIKKIHSLGMKVMIKPHLDLIDVSGGSWRGEIACSTAPDWDKWFDSYGKMMLRYAKIAQDNKVEMLCIGTELTSVSTIKESLWKTKIIEPVRSIYKGPLTYAANWKDEYMYVTFWKDVDYVGIDAYFPLSEADEPSLADIKKGWEVWVKEIEKFQAEVGKPIIFPEIGYCSNKGTAKKPWDEPPGRNIDLKLQEDCYRAVFDIFWDKDWFYGVYWWRWGTDIRFGGPNNRSFSLQNKPAEKLVAEWYAKPVPVKKKR